MSCSSGLHQRREHTRHSHGGAQGAPHHAQAPIASLLCSRLALLKSTAACVSERRVLQGAGVRVARRGPSPTQPSKAFAFVAPQKIQGKFAAAGCRLHSLYSCDAQQSNAHTHAINKRNHGRDHSRSGPLNKPANSAGTTVKAGCRRPPKLHRRVIGSRQPQVRRFHVPRVWRRGVDKSATHASPSVTTDDGDASGDSDVVPQ